MLKFRTLSNYLDAESDFLDERMKETWHNPHVAYITIGFLFLRLIVTFLRIYLHKSEQEYILKTEGK